jgi:hypothetical protein
MSGRKIARPKLALREAPLKFLALTLNLFALLGLLALEVDHPTLQPPIVLFERSDARQQPEEAV